MRIDPIMEAGLRELRVREGLHAIDQVLCGYEQSCRMLEDLKARLKKRYRELALELHPDHNAELPEEERLAREDRLKGLTAAMDLVGQIRVKPPHMRRYGPPLQPSFRICPMYSTTAGTSTTNTSTTNGTWTVIFGGF